jgi:holin-like protein
VLAAFAVLLLCQFLGSALVWWTQAPLPGPVAGLLLLLLVLRWRQGAPAWLRDTGRVLLENLSLLFVPAGVGLLAHGARLAPRAAALALVLLLSTVATLTITGLVLRVLLRLASPPETK